jgi:hypothetical protein
LDNDGDGDAIIGHLDGPAVLLRNDTRCGTERDPGSVCLRLIGTRGNRDAVGARISVPGAQPALINQIKGGSSYLAAHDMRVIIATAGWSREPLIVDVEWPGSNRASSVNLPAAGSYLLIEPASVGQPVRTIHASSQW